MSPAPLTPIGKESKTRPHINALTLMHAWLLETFGNRFVNAKAPIDVSSADHSLNEPVPDLIVLNRDSSAFTAHPQPPDIDLIVEIAHSTLHFDLTTKAALYARAAIIEYWVLDIAERRLIAHRDPEAGQYTTITVYSEHEPINPLALPSIEFRPALAFEP